MRIETIIFDKNSRNVISSGTRHRIKRDDDGNPICIEISRKNCEGFRSYDGDVVYYYFEGPYAYKSPVISEN